MRLVVAVVGKPRHRALATAIEEYEQRAARYWPLDVQEVRAERARGAPADLVREREAERLRARVAPGTHLVACDAAGRGMDSASFARWLHGEREADRDVVFLIGGAFGLASSLRAQAPLSLSLAPWTLPHELARLVLAEQLYRAGTIVRGEPYHK